MFLDKGELVTTMCSCAPPEYAAVDPPGKLLHCKDGRDVLVPTKYAQNVSVLCMFHVNPYFTWT